MRRTENTMAMSDYGAILKIDGEIKNENIFFMDMKEAVGWVDLNNIRYDDCDCIDSTIHASTCDVCPRAGESVDCRGFDIYPDSLNGNYFVYAGDENFTVAVYKTRVTIRNSRGEIPFEDNYTMFMGDIYNWKFDHVVKHLNFIIDNKPIHVKIKRIGESYTEFYLSFTYNDRHYEIVYGYGIDSNLRLWDRYKHRYICNNKVIRFVDKFINKRY